MASIAVKANRIVAEVAVAIDKVAQEAIRGRVERIAVANGTSRGVRTVVDCLAIPFGVNVAYRAGIWNEGDDSIAY